MTIEIENYKDIDNIPSLELRVVSWIQFRTKVRISHRSKTKIFYWNSFYLYARHTRRYINNVEYETLDIASIEIPKNKRRRGWFKYFDQMLTLVCPWDAIYYEAVNPEFQHYFLRNKIPEVQDDNCNSKSKNFIRILKST